MINFQSIFSIIKSKKLLKEIDALTMKSTKQNVDKALDKITDKGDSPTDEEQIEDDLDADDSFIKFLRYDF